jgi:hypothetical protein
MSTLDFAVAQAAFRARQMERALHDPGPWTISWGDCEVPASRLIGRNRIVFLAHFPARCHLAVPEPLAILQCAGDLIGTQEIEFPGDGEFELEWTLAIEQPVPA